MTLDIKFCADCKVVFKPSDDKQDICLRCKDKNEFYNCKSCNGFGRVVCDNKGIVGAYHGGMDYSNCAIYRCLTCSGTGNFSNQSQSDKDLLKHQQQIKKGLDYLYNDIVDNVNFLNLIPGKSLSYKVDIRRFVNDVQLVFNKIDEV